MLIKYTTVILLSMGICLLLLTSTCSSSSNNSLNQFKPNWEGIDVSTLDLQFGQEIAITINHVDVPVIVVDFNDDEAGEKTWYGFCFLNKNQLFGRQIPSGFINTTCVDLLDFIYLETSLLENYCHIKYHHLDIEQISMGSIEIPNNYAALLSSYRYGLVLREKPQTPCTKDIISRTATRECYFPIEKIQQ